MKPWLNEILACPVDKHYPLELLVFTIENEQEAIEHSSSIEKMAADLEQLVFAGSVDREGPVGIEQVISVTSNNGETLVRDTLVRKPRRPSEYIEGILDSIHELEAITFSKPEWFTRMVDDALALEGTFKKMSLEAREGGTNDQDVLEFIISRREDLLRLNWLKQFVEIEEGILVCKQCSRWFPIDKTIPQLLPDALRKKSEDLAFLQRWKEVLEKDGRRITTEGMPFHL